MTPRVVIAGAGLAGLNCAATLGGGYRIVERGRRPGGLCLTERIGRFTIDHTGHYLHFRDPGIRAQVTALLGRNLLAARRDSWFLARGVLTPAPVQANIFGHAPDVVRECILSLLAARAAGDRRPRNYAEWFEAAFGRGIARHFLLPLNRKQYLTDPRKLSPLQGGRFVPRPDPDEVVRGALARRPLAIGYNADMMHPRGGGIEALPRALAAGLRRPVETGREVLRVRWRERRAVLADGEAMPYDVLVSTLPLPDLLDRLEPLPAALARIRGAFRWIGVLTVHVCVRRPRERHRHWIYTADPGLAFYRVGFPTNIVPGDAPPGHGIMSAEVSYLPGRRPSDATVLRRVLAGLARLRLLGSRRDVEATFIADFPVAYVLMDGAYERIRREALGFLARSGIASIGRYGGWVYGGMEDALREGRDAARAILRWGGRAPARLRAGG